MHQILANAVDQSRSLLKHLSTNLKVVGCVISVTILEIFVVLFEDIQVPVLF